MDVLDQPEKELPTSEEFSKFLASFADDVTKLKSYGPENIKLRNEMYKKVEEKMEDLKRFSSVENYFDLFFNSGLYKHFQYIVALENTKISSHFISFIIDFVDSPENAEKIIKDKLVNDAINACEDLDEVNYQTDAQFLYEVFKLITELVDGCDDAEVFIEDLVKNTKLLSVILKQFNREDFDENVLEASEVLIVSIQIYKNCVSIIDDALINRILFYCSNLRSTSNANEDEFASNCYDIISSIAIDEVGVKKLESLLPIELLLGCWSTKKDSEKSISSKLTIKTIVTCLMNSPIMCEQFVNSGGIKKLFSSLNHSSFTKNTKKSKRLNDLVSIILSLMVRLSSDSIHFQRVFRKFIEKDHEKLNLIIDIAENFFSHIDVSKDDDDSWSIFQSISCVVLIIFGFSKNETRVSILTKVSGSKLIDMESIVDAAKEYIDEYNFTDNIKAGVELYSEIEKSL